MLNKMKTQQLKRSIRRALKDFQFLVRLSSSDLNGICVCCTCDKHIHWQACDGGHFISAEYARTAFDPRNVHPQCKHCNKHRHGAPARYYEFMLRRYGKQVITELERAAGEPKLWSHEELVDMRMEYRNRIYQIGRERGWVIKMC